MRPAINSMQPAAEKVVSRNVLCPHYNTCLDHAVEKNLPSWDCSTCMHKHTKERIDPSEFERCGNLINKIFSKNHNNREFFNERKHTPVSLPRVSAKKWLRTVEKYNDEKERIKKILNAI